MSHGPASEGGIEPNLTPLLDLVLQLLMFFMITVNFTQGVTNTGESLPFSETAMPLDKDGNDPIILSVKPFRIDMDGDGKKRDDFKYFTKDERQKLHTHFAENELCILDPLETLTQYERDHNIGRETLVRNLKDATKHLTELAQKERDKAKEEMDTYKQIRKARVDKDNNVTIPVHIRADADVKTGEIYNLLDACKDAGFVNIKARALLGSGVKK